MLCESCRVREARILYQEIINGQATQHYYCLECAREKGFPQLVFDKEFPLSKLLSGLLAQTAQNAGDKKNAEYARIVCPTCGTTYDEFVASSRFGCADCYEVFDLLIGDTIRKLQGTTEHKGRSPKMAAGKIPEGISRELTGRPGDAPSDERLEELLLLKQQLKASIAQEEFEEAAKLRDRIRSLEAGKEGRDHG